MVEPTPSTASGTDTGDALPEMRERLRLPGGGGESAACAAACCAAAPLLPRTNMRMGRAAGEGVEGQGEGGRSGSGVGALLNLARSASVSSHCPWAQGL